MKMLARFLVALLVLPVLAAPEAGAQEKKYRLLYLTQSKGFTHGSVRFTRFAAAWCHWHFMWRRMDAVSPTIAGDYAARTATIK